MSTAILVCVGQESSTVSGVVAYTYQGGTLVEASRANLENDTHGASAVVFAPDGQSVYIVTTDEPGNKTYLEKIPVAADGTLGAVERLLTLENSEINASALAINSAGTRVAFGWSSFGSTSVVQLIDVESATPSVLETAAPSTGADVRDLAFNDDGTRLLVAEGITHLALFDVSSDALTEADTLAATGESVAFVPGSASTWWYGALDTTDNDVKVIDAASDTLSVSDSVSDFGTLGGESVGNIVALDGSSALTPDGTFEWNGTAVSQGTNANLGADVYLAVSPDSAWAATVAPGASSIGLKLWDLSDYTEADHVTDPVGGTERYVAFRPSRGPTTDEERFQASYADASAAPPKVTALIRPADVQRSIDTDVSNLAGGPNYYTVEAVFDVGELENLNPYNPTTEKARVFFVKDEQPGLREGKNLLLKGYTIRDGNPSVPVTCTFWG